MFVLETYDQHSPPQDPGMKLKSILCIFACDHFICPTGRSDFCYLFRTITVYQTKPASVASHPPTLSVTSPLLCCSFLSLLRPFALSSAPGKLPTAERGVCRLDLPAVH